MKFVLCPVEVTVSSDMVERISKFVHCAMDHDYEPYSKQGSGNHGYYSFLDCFVIQATIAMFYNLMIKKMFSRCHN